MTPSPSPSLVEHVATLAPDQWNLVLVALGIAVFAIGALLMARL
jgi:hypothetical protein